MVRRHRSIEQATSPTRPEQSKLVKELRSEKCMKPTKLRRLTSWSSRMVACSSHWLSRELCGVLEDRGIARNALAEDPMKFIPSVVSFFVINKCLALTSSIMGSVASLTEVLSWHDIEAMMSGAVIFLLWVGAFRIVSNTFNKIMEASKLRGCKYPD